MTDDVQVSIDYFHNRKVNPEFYSDYRLPPYFKNVLPLKNDINILDIGCGFGQMLSALKEIGYKNIKGIDIDATAVSYCLGKGLDVVAVESINKFCASYGGRKFDFIMASHVLEHIDKSKLIETVKLIKEKLLSPSGSFLIMVPNAQSNTGCYWAYEDFTHSTLFTAGSIYYVLKNAGFENVEFLDPENLEGSNVFIRVVKKVLLCIYRANIKFWNLVTGSSFHKPSPQIFSYELKVLAK